MNPIRGFSPKFWISKISQLGILTDEFFLSVNISISSICPHY